MQLSIYVAIQGLEAAHRTRLLHALNGHVCVFDSDLRGESDRSAAIAEAEVVFGNLPPSHLVKARALRWVQLESAGYEAYVGLRKGLTGTPFLVTNLHGFFGRSVAETALAGLLSHYRQLSRLMCAQTSKAWIQTRVNPDMDILHGRRVIILGAGDIGQRMAALLRAFDCPVKLFARTSADAVLRSLPELDEALSWAQILVNTLPHSESTVGLLDAGRLKRLSRNSVFVNVGRGSITREAVLLEALEEGCLSGAVLDVTEIEPLPKESPLWEHPGVILTQHTGGRFKNELNEKVEVFIENFSRFVRGENLTGAIHER